MLEQLLHLTHGRANIAVACRAIACCICPLAIFDSTALNLFASKACNMQVVRCPFYSGRAPRLRP